jgi:hypothetical protein
VIAPARAVAPPVLLLDNGHGAAPLILWLCKHPRESGARHGRSRGIGSDRARAVADGVQVAITGNAAHLSRLRSRPPDRARSRRYRRCPAPTGVAGAIEAVARFGGLDF